MCIPQMTNNCDTKTLKNRSVYTLALDTVHIACTCMTYELIPIKSYMGYIRVSINHIYYNP